MQDTRTETQDAQVNIRYTPDQWVLLRITNKETQDVHQRVFAGWFGGFTSGDRWQLNSGVVDTYECNDYFVFTSASGKEYVCFKNSQGVDGMSMYMRNVLNSFINEANEANEVLSIEIVKI